MTVALLTESVAGPYRGELPQNRLRISPLTSINVKSKTLILTLQAIIGAFTLLGVPL